MRDINTRCGQNSHVRGSLVTTAWHVFQAWRVAADILNKRSRTTNKEWFSRLGGGEGGVGIQLRKLVTNCHNGPRTWMDFFIYADVNILGDNIDPIKKNKET
jgi:hypothetical protein